MKEKTISVFSAVYRILLTVSIIAAGLCLIYGCLTIYFTGDHTYSSQIVAEVFNKISIPVYICLGLIGISILLNLFIPDKEKIETKANPAMKLQFLYKRKELSKEDINYDQIHIEIIKRFIVTISQYILLFISAIPFLIYALNSKNFDTTQINSSVINAMFVLIPCLVFMFLTSIITEVYKTNSIKREICLVSGLPDSKKSTENDKSPDNNSNRKITIIRSVILLIGIGLLAYGFFSGGTADVLTKAVNICTECIGLG